MAAQNQHYVPKFILRQFLSDPAHERVTVYDKHTEKIFVSSIKNVMAERRFHDFTFDDEFMVSFEPVACGAENEILPAYQSVLDERKLDGTIEQKESLALLMAFQLLRTKAHRDQWRNLEDALRNKVEEDGGRMQDVQGWEDWQPSTEDELKRQHLLFMQENLIPFAQIIAQKDFLLAEPSPGRSFYLGDNPVSLSNERDFGPYGNLGLAVPGIEIYLPLSSKLMLGAWCPTILQQARDVNARGKTDRRSEALARLRAGTLTPDGMRQLLERVKPLEELADALVNRFEQGRPIPSTEENMDYYNSLQTSYAYRYVVCQKADFDLARRYNKEFPKFRTGRRPTFS
jgi:hypothetical protein